MSNRVADDPYSGFRHLTFAAFQERAADASLSRYEKIGFPDAYRQGREGAIFRDIERKLTNLSKQNQTVMDIGPGCSELPSMLIDLCRSRSHALVLVDSAEMLRLLPDERGCSKVAGRFPADCGDVMTRYRGAVDAILTYSVLQYVFAEASVFEFLDRCLELLGDGGELLIGDIPNASTRKRFFASAAGIRFHREFTGTNETPAAVFNRLEPGEIDDAVVFSLIQRARAAGFHAYVVPQPADLPMANRREDILIRKP